MTQIEKEIYFRLKHIVDDLYRKKGISTVDIRRHFMIRKNFNKLIKVMSDIKFIYNEQKYPLSFEDCVYSLLFDRILMDRIYYEKDNPEESQAQEKKINNYKTFINENKKESFNLDRIPTPELRKLVADYEFKANKAEKNKELEAAKNYRELFKLYSDEVIKREEEMVNNFRKRVDKNGYWIPRIKSE